jgi:ribonuclease J
MSFVGVISVAITLDSKGEIVDGPEFEMVGIPERNAEGAMMENIIAEAIINALDSLPRARLRDPGSVAESMRRAVRSAVAQQWGKKPLCLVHVMTG